MISSLAMALEYSLDRKDLAVRIESAIQYFIREGFRTKDISTSSDFIKTSEVATILIDFLKNE
jgi:isocitrate/isopropylmalate dehydrogenase